MESPQIERIKIKRELTGVMETIYRCSADGEILLRIVTDGHSYPDITPGQCDHYDWYYATKYSEIPSNAVTWVKGGLLYFYIFPR